MSSQKIDKNDIESLATSTFDGISVFTRDTNLTDSHMNSYRQGQIILERGYVDASNKSSGIITSHRYLILSNSFSDFSNFGQNPEWGLCIGKSGSRFKVMDIFEYEEKTQIILLHLPGDDRWKYFKFLSFDLEDELVVDMRNLFKDKIHAPMDPALASDQWLHRCKFPLGMSNECKLFEIEEVYDDVFLFATRIAGTSYIENIEELEKVIHFGDMLIFRSEPENSYDNHAIRIETKAGQKLGYIPKSDNLVISNLMAEGKIVYGKVGNISTEGSWYKIEIEIYLRLYNI